MAKRKKNFTRPMPKAVAVKLNGKDSQLPVISQNILDEKMYKGVKRDCRTNKICIRVQQPGRFGGYREVVIANQDEKQIITLDHKDLLVRINRKTSEIVSASIYVGIGEFRYIQYNIDHTCKAILDLVERNLHKQQTRAAA